MNNSKNLSEQSKFDLNQQKQRAFSVSLQKISPINNDVSAKSSGDIIIYQTEDGLTKINVNIQEETVWLNQQQLVTLYQSSKSNISEHIKHIFAEEELDEQSVVRNSKQLPIRETS